MDSCGGRGEGNKCESGCTIDIMVVDGGSGGGGGSNNNSES